MKLKRVLFFILVLLSVSNHILCQPNWDNFANESGCMLLIYFLILISKLILLVFCSVFLETTSSRGLNPYISSFHLYKWVEAWMGLAGPAPDHGGGDNWGWASWGKGLQVVGGLALSPSGIPGQSPSWGDNLNISLLLYRIVSIELQIRSHSWLQACMYNHQLDNSSFGVR